MHTEYTQEPYNTVISAGYIGSKSFLSKVGEIIQDVKNSCPGLVYGKFTPRKWIIFLLQCPETVLIFYRVDNNLTMHFFALISWSTLDHLVLYVYLVVIIAIYMYPLFIWSIFFLKLMKLLLKLFCAILFISVLHNKNIMSIMMLMCFYDGKQLSHWHPF